MPTKWTNKETMEKFLKGLEKSQLYFNNHCKNMYKIDTDEVDKVTIALNISNKIIELIEKAE